MTSFGAYLLQTLVSLAAVCALAFVVLYSVRRFGGGRANGPLSLVGQLPLGGNRVVYLVRVGAQFLVLGAGDAGLTRLGELSEAEAAAFEADAARPPRSFASILAKAQRVATGKPRTTSDENRRLATGAGQEQGSLHEESVAARSANARPNATSALAGSSAAAASQSKSAEDASAAPGAAGSTTDSTERSVQ